MVKLAEWRGKEIFRRYDLPLPKGQVVRTGEEAREATRSGKVPLPCVAKAQVLAGGRGKGGAVRFASSADEAAEVTQAILALEFKGEPVREVLLEEKVALRREFYVALALDRSARLPVLIASAHGGVEIESVEETAILRIPIQPFVGLVGYEKRRVAEALGLSGELKSSLFDLLSKLWSIFQQEDAELVEINPLAETDRGLVALDAKVIVEDDATFRHPGYAEIRDDRTPLEEIAREQGIAFVQLDGNLGVIANGAGLTMATLDVLAELGGKPGIFLDLGGTDDPAKVTQAFLLLSKAHPSAVFLNIFGGVTRCDTVARGLVEALQKVPEGERFPLVARIRGNNEAEGLAILKAAGVVSLPDLKAAVQATIEAAKGRELVASGGSR